jgi:hypothetical protein
MVQVTSTIDETVYLSKCRNLIIAYSIAIAASLAGIVLGSYAIHRNGRVDEASLSTFATTLQDPGVMETVEVLLRGLVNNHPDRGRNTNSTKLVPPRNS